MEEEMKKRLCGKKWASLVLFAAFLALSTSLVPAGKGPKIKFREESKDFGRVKQGEALTHVFVFKNEGDETLKIKSVRTSCGCAAALASNDEIAPGKSGEVKVTFDTRGYVQKTSKYIYVESNDLSQSMTTLTLMADIEVPPMPRMNLSVYSIDLGLILENEEIRAKAKVENSGELELEASFIHKEASFYWKGKKISSPLRVASGKAEEFEIRIPAPKRTGLVREYIQVRSNDPLRPTLSLSLSGYIVTHKQLKELFAKYKNIID